VSWFNWGQNPDYKLKIHQGARLQWRWEILHKNEVVALSPVQGWSTEAMARDAAHRLLAAIGATIPEEVSDE